MRIGLNITANFLLERKLKMTFKANTQASEIKSDTEIVRSGIQSFMTKTIVVALGAIICCALWGSAFPCIKIGYKLFGIGDNDAFSQILFAGIRFFLAGIFTVLIGSAVEKRPLIPSRKLAGKIIILSMFQTIIQYLFFYIGLSHTTGVKASVLDGASVFIALFVSTIIFRLEKITPAKILGSLVGFVGVILINLTGLDFQFSFSGEGFILISAIGYALSSVFMKRYSSDTSPLLLSGWQFMLGGAVMAIVGVIFGGTLKITHAKAVFMLLYLALLSAVAYSLWSVLLKYNPVSKVTVFGFMNPVFGSVFSIIFLRESESFGLSAVCSLVLVSIGIYIVNRKESNHQKL